MSRRAEMEASETKGLLPRKVSGEPALQRIDSSVVAQILAAERSAGILRLQVMLDSVIGRLVAVDPPPAG
jgi:hypothetical protein